MPSTIGFRRRETKGAAVYTIDKDAARTFFQFVLMFFGWLFTFILGFAVWVLVWRWLGGENATDPHTGRIAYWAGLAAGILAGLMLLLLFRWLWRRIGANFSVSQQGITKDGRLIPWSELEELRIIDSSSGMDYVRDAPGGYGMSLARQHGMALAVDAAGKRLLLAVALDLPRAERLYRSVAADVTRLRR
jgi:hypothetical protein